MKRTCTVIRRISFFGLCLLVATGCQDQRPLQPSELNSGVSSAVIEFTSLVDWGLDRYVGVAALAPAEDVAPTVPAGQCFLEYRRADGLFSRMVRRLPVSPTRSTEPFFFVARDQNDVVLFRAVCLIPRNRRDIAARFVRWEPGRGTLAAGKSWSPATQGGMPLARSETECWFVGDTLYCETPDNALHVVTCQGDLRYDAFWDQCVCPNGNLVTWGCDTDTGTGDPGGPGGPGGGHGGPGGEGPGDGEDPDSVSSYEVWWDHIPPPLPPDTALIRCDSTTNYAIQFNDAYCNMAVPLSSTETQNLALTIAAIRGLGTQNANCTKLADALQFMLTNQRIRKTPSNTGMVGEGTQHQSQSGNWWSFLATAGGAHLLIADYWLSGSRIIWYGSPNPAWRDEAVTLQSIVSHEGEHAAVSLGWLPAMTTISGHLEYNGTVNPMQMRYTEQCGQVAYR